jgi:hypothetical protein
MCKDSTETVGDIKKRRMLERKQTRKSKVRPSIRGGSLLDILFHHKKRQLLQGQSQKSKE